MGVWMGPDGVWRPQRWSWVLHCPMSAHLVHISFSITQLHWMRPAPQSVHGSSACNKLAASTWQRRRLHPRRHVHRVTCNHVSRRANRLAKGEQQTDLRACTCTRPCSPPPSPCAARSACSPAPDSGPEPRVRLRSGIDRAADVAYVDINERRAPRSHRRHGKPRHTQRVVRLWFLWLISGQRCGWPWTCNRRTMTFNEIARSDVCVPDHIDLLNPMLAR